MSEESSISNSQQDILKDLMVGRDLTTRDITQQNIEKQINLLLLNIPDNGSINKAFSAIIPDDWYNWRGKPKDNNDILKQLEEIPYQNSTNSPLLNFIYLLTKDNNIPQTTREKLKHLLTNQSFQNNGRSTSSQALHSYLLIQLRPDANQELFVKAWFIPDDTIQDPWERFKPLTVDEQQPEIPFVPEKLPLLLGNLLQQCFEEYLQGQPTELTIEIFLPRDRLCDEVEKWSYQDSEGLDITIGAEHRVVVRSYDRLKTLRKQQGSYWKKNWENLQLIWQDIPCIEQITTISQACFDPNHLRKSLIEKIVLKVCCNLSNSDRDGLLKAIHSAGTPIVIWSRCEVTNLKNPHHFDALLEKPLQELSACVKEQRLAADHDMHLGNHLVLLWDDPNRIPPNPALEFSAL
jgi:vWA-MoxR associated protein C-terminal domain/vWA-MoxR associated protein middle region (VMAP-M) 1